MAVAEVLPEGLAATSLEPVCVVARVSLLPCIPSPEGWLVRSWGRQPQHASRQHLLVKGRRARV